MSTMRSGRHGEDSKTGEIWNMHVNLLKSSIGALASSFAGHAHEGQGSFQHQRITVESTWLGYSRSYQKTERRPLVPLRRPSLDGPCCYGGRLWATARTTASS